MTDVIATVEGGIGTEYTRVEIINPEDIKDSDGNPIGFDEFRVLSAGQVDAAYFDGGSPVVYPQLGMTQAEGKEFEQRLIKTLTAMQKELQRTPWQADWLIEAGKTALTPDQLELLELEETLAEQQANPGASGQTAHSSGSRSP
jgi:hypothetical protein